MSENLPYEYIPKYVPRPHATGQYKSSPDTHFFLAEFVDMVDSQSVSEKADSRNLHSRRGYPSRPELR